MSKRPSVNFTYLDQMSGGDSASRRELLQMLINELKTFPRQMSACLQSGDWDGLQKKSHHFKSTLSFAGYAELIRTNKELEQLSRSRGDAKRAGELMKQVEGMCRQVLPVLEQELKR